METELWMHVDSSSGHVWFGSPAHMLDTVEGLNISAALATEQFLAARTVRLLGCGANAALIETLVKTPGDRKVLLGNPQQHQECDPLDALGVIWDDQKSTTPSMSWYALQPTDEAVYGLVAAVRRQDWQSALYLLPRHPAWPAISFVNINAITLSRSAALLALICDVRWFVHPSKPNQPRLLHSFLGLTPNNFAALAARTEGRYHFARAQLAVEAWEGIDPLRLPTTSPGDFLLRLYVEAPSRQQGLLSATKRFINFIYHVWRGHGRDHNQLCFDPVSFFKDKTLTDAFVSHREGLGRL